VKFYIQRFLRENEDKDANKECAFNRFLQTGTSNHTLRNVAGRMHFSLPGVEMKMLMGRVPRTKKTRIF